MRSIAFILLFALSLQAAEFDIPYNQRRSDGGNTERMFSPGANMLMGTDASRQQVSLNYGLFLQTSQNLADVANPGIALDNLGGTTLGKNLFTAPNPSAVRYPRVNADNTVTWLDASAFLAAIGGGTGSGSVTSVSVATANGVSGNVANPTTTPQITITLGAITPTSVAASGAVTGSNLSNTNTGDQTSIVGITGTLAEFNAALTGADFATGGGTATGTNTGDQTNISGNAATVTTNANLTGPVTSVGNATTITANSITGAMIALGSDAQGDLMYYNGTDWVRLAAGVDGLFLKTQGAGANPTWAAPAGSGDVTGPATHAAGLIPVWGVANSKNLLAGLATSIGTGSMADVGKVALFGSSAELRGRYFEALSGTLLGSYGPTDWSVEEPGGGFVANFSSLDLTGNRTWRGPDKDGTLAVTTDIPAQYGVNFNGATADNVTGTYVRAATTITITRAAHGHIVGHRVACNFTSGGATNGTYAVVSVIDADNFTITVPAAGTSGNVTLNRRLIRDSDGVHSVAYASAGNFWVNFTADMGDTGYRFDAEASSAGVAVFTFPGNAGNVFTASFLIGTTNSTFATGVDATFVSAEFWR